MKHSSYPHPADDWTAVMLNVTAVVFGSWTAWALVAVIVALCGCSGQRRVAVVAARYPTSFAKECASRYPVKDSTVTNTVYREGAVQLIPGDTVRVDCDTVHEYTSGGRDLPGSSCALSASAAAGGYFLRNDF